MKISFDFDGTIERPYVQTIARDLVNSGNDVWIVTRRGWGDHLEVEAVAKKVGIPLDKIIYTSGVYKWQTLKDNNFDLHYDNSDIEIFLIKANTNVKTIKV